MFIILEGHFSHVNFISMLAYCLLSADMSESDTDLQDRYKLCMSLTSNRYQNMKSMVNSEEWEVVVIMHNSGSLFDEYKKNFAKGKIPVFF